MPCSILNFNVLIILYLVNSSREMKRILLILVSMTMVCCSRPNKSVEECKSIEEYKKEYADYILRYQIEPLYINGQLVGNESLLDSALYIAKAGIDKYQDDYFKFGKISVLILKQQYEDAAKYVKSADMKFFNECPFWRNSSYYKFMAVQAQVDNQPKRMRRYLNKGIDEVQAYLTQHESEIDTFLKEKTGYMVVQGPYSLALSHYYFLFTRLYGYEKAKAEIDALGKKYENANELWSFIDQYMQTPNEKLPVI